METVIITGGLGFIGSHSAISLHKSGYKVVIIDNLSRPTPNIEYPDENSYNLTLITKDYPNIIVFKEDIRNREKIEEIFKIYTPNFILHAAGQTSAVDSISHPRNDFENNVIGLFNTLESARLYAPNCTFLYLSTNKVYGDVNPSNLIEESLRYDNKVMKGVSENMSVDQSKHTPYGISKLSGDLYVQEYGSLYDMKTIVFRMSCIYGSRQFGFVEQGWISHFIISILKGRPITIFGSGKQVRDVLYIDDLVRLIQLIFKSKKSTNNGSSIYNIGGGLDNTISLLEFFNIYQTDLKFEKVREGDQKYFVSDISKVEREYNWKPQISPTDGIRKTYKWVKKNLILFK